MSTSPNVVSGAISSVAELGKDGSWLQAWLKEQPVRLGLGDLTVADSEPVQDDDGNPAFLASDEQRYYCVDVRLGELEASQGFGVLHNWARNRVRHPDKNHVAVLVTESTGERYRSTLATLSEHLPLVVVELQVWRGENEAIIVPHVALASADVDLSSTPAAAAARAMAEAGKDVASATAEVEPGKDAASATAEVEPAAGPAEAEREPDQVGGEPDATDQDDSGNADNKDDTGVVDPWGTASAGQGEDAPNGSPRRLLTKIS